MKDCKAFWGLIFPLLCSTLALAAPTSDIAKRSLSSLARTSQLPQGQARQQGGEKRGVYNKGVFGYGPLLQDLEARRVREAALREALIRHLNRGDMYEDDNGIVDKRNVASLARAGELRAPSPAALNAKRNVAALLRQAKYGSPPSTEVGSHPDEDEDEAAFAANPDDADRPEKRTDYTDWSDRHLPDFVHEEDCAEYDELCSGAAPVKRFLGAWYNGRIPNMGRHRQKQTSGRSGIKTSRRRPHSS